MTNWFRELDELLRGRKTLARNLATGQLQLSLRLFTMMAALLGAAYGFFTGWFAVFDRTPPAYWQLLASTLKLPALFLLTLVVTFPSLYVFNALVGCRLTWTTTLRLLIGAVVVNLAVAASLGPILGFFTLSTTSYSFMVLLNVVLLAIAGIVGLSFLMQVLRQTARWQARITDETPRPDLLSTPTEPPADDLGNTAAAETPPGAAPPNPRARPLEEADALGPARSVFQLWIIIYGLVGAQMGWLLRPFVGNPNLPFAWFRPRSGNFFEALVGVLQSLFGVK